MSSNKVFGKKVFSSNFGSPVSNDLHSLTAGISGPIVMEDVHFLEKISSFDRERTPERVVHAKGAGAYGYFELTADVSKYTRAAFLNKVGKKTDVFVRFSTVGGEKGSADSERDPRGFAIKFYTEEGNYDMVGNNTPVFFIRDPLKFPDFIHTQKRNPATNLKDQTMFWDFLSLTPESIHQVTILFSDRGTPASFRHMHGYSSHTYKWYTDANNYYWVQYHFKSDQGIINLDRHQAEELRGQDPDHATRDLHDSIAKGDYPSWTLEMQIMTPEQAKSYHYDINDITKVWPHADFPPIKIGKLVLNRNPENYFAEVEQAAFNPSNFVPGIAPSNDKMLLGRLFSYHDTHLHRLGTNYHLIPVNQPKHAAVNNFQRDGAMRVDNGGGAGPNYWPNSFAGIEPQPELEQPQGEANGGAGRYEYPKASNDFEQAGALYKNVLSTQDKSNLIDNIVNHLGVAVQRIQYRQCALFYLADADYGERVAKGLKLDIEKIKKLAAMPAAERAVATAL